jgi:tetratricopeptide (TPR) repeat protein
LPSNRPDIGGRPGIANRPSQLPALGAGAAIGAGIANRVGERPGTLPGIGDRRPGISQLPAQTPGQRLDSLRDRVAGGERPSQLPNRDWNQTRQDWQQRRDDIREDWQQHRDEARDDWQDWLDDHYGWYGGWYGGFAPGYWNRWDYLWDNYPVAAVLGLTWWGANALGYSYGYSDYTNPYYADSMPAYYSEPIITVPMESAPDAGAVAAGLPPGVSQDAMTKFDQARGAFLEGRYAEALKLTDEAITQMPRDAVLHEFRSLALFALGRYAESAAIIHAVLDVGPGWDWKTMGSLYSSVDEYTKQLRALEAARDKDRNAADLRFLLGYHYLTLGSAEDALTMFRRVVELQPKDTVAAALVATLSPRDAQVSAPATAAAAKAIPSDNVVGNWTATGSGSAEYSMNLKKDGTFTWTYRRGQRKQEAKGVYVLEGNVLAMEPDSGGILAAELAVKDGGLLHFKMIGGNKDDAGLDFRRGMTQ